MLTRRTFLAVAGAGLFTLLRGATYLDIPIMAQTFSALQTGILFDNGYSADQTNYFAASPFSSWRFTTSTTRVWVKVYTNIYGDYPQWAHIGVRNNGAYLTTLECAANGVNVFDVAITPGTVEFVTGLQSKPSALEGTYLQAAYFYGNTPTTTQQTPSASNRILFYGDSIAVGASATYPTKEGAAVLVRDAFNGSVMVEGWGYRTLYDDGVDATARQTFSTRLAGYAPSRIWLAIGTNDYALNKWTAANFGTAYADLLDKLHTDLPSATIFCQSPLIRTTETANAGGSTLPNYRTQISDAAAARSSYCTYVEGSTILTTGNLADGVHPTTTGHAIWAAAIKTALGIS